ncbi:hypothetical protein F5883DRAFT_593534 [Diaporthe sp. PMI_573]|nr:hypothetical protein F5883DRAFT_593534 [Diaporthaceae sp. PMI_573]
MARILITCTARLPNRCPRCRKGMQKVSIAAYVQMQRWRVPANHTEQLSRPAARPLADSWCVSKLLIHGCEARRSPLQHQIAHPNQAELYCPVQYSTHCRTQDINEWAFARRKVDTGSEYRLRGFPLLDLGQYCCQSNRTDCIRRAGDPRLTALYILREALNILTVYSRIKVSGFIRFILGPSRSHKSVSDIGEGHTKLPSGLDLRFSHDSAVVTGTLLLSLLSNMFDSNATALL